MIDIYILILPDTLMLDAIGPAEVFQYANRLSQKQGRGELYRLHFVGPEAKAANSLNLPLNLSPLPDTLPKDAWLLVAGLVGDTFCLDTKPIQLACQWIKAHSFNKYISVCAGALILAKAGLLAHRQCTTHHLHLDDLTSLLSPHQVLENRLFVIDDGCYTSAGVTAGIDLALYLVQQEQNACLAAKIAQNMVLFSRRGSQDPSLSPWLSFRSHLEQRVHLVQDAIQANPAKHWTMAELAEIAHCSERHLSRLFKQETQTTIKDYIHSLRLNLAEHLLSNSTLNIEKVAEQCGFDDARQFRRLWQRHYHTSPRAFRNTLP